MSRNGLHGSMTILYQVFGRVRRGRFGAREDAAEGSAHQASPGDPVRPAPRVQLAQDHPGMVLLTVLLYLQRINVEPKPRQTRLDLLTP